MKKAIRDICIILAIGLVAFGANTASAGQTNIPAGNFSFESVGAASGGWNSLPADGAWTDVNPAGVYQILNLTTDGAHFPSYDEAPGGGSILYLKNASPTTNDLGYAVSAGDVIAVSYVLGDSTNDAAWVPGDVEVAILVDGVVSDSETVANSAADGDFKAFRSVLTAAASGNLSVRFTNVSGRNWLDLVDVSKVPSAQTPVGNFSFETEGNDTPPAGGWYELPDTGSWVKGETHSYQILDISGGPDHFPAGIAPEGDNVLNLRTTDPIQQDLGTAISSGQDVTIDFHLGDSAKETPGDVTVAILVDGVVDTSETIANTAADGEFAAHQSVLRATSSGNLSIRFTNSGGYNWLDNVNVKVSSSLPQPSFSGLTASPTITYGTPTVALSGVVSATGPIYPVDGESVAVTINSFTTNATIAGGSGAFSVSFPSATIACSASPYTITYAYAGNGSTLRAADDDTTTSLTVNQAALTITADDDSKGYGETKTYGAGSTAFTSSGLKNSDAIGTVTITDTENGGDAGAQPGAYTLTPSAAVFSSGSAANYDITYATGTLTVGLPLRLVAEAEVQVDAAGPIGTAQTPTPVTHTPVTFGVTAGYIDGDLFQISSGGALTFQAQPDNDVGDVYYVEVTVEDSATPTANSDKMLVKVTVVSSAVPAGTLFKFQ